MCVGPEQSNTKTTDPPLLVETRPVFGSECPLSDLLEFAADNDVEGFKTSIKGDVSLVGEVGVWYGRPKCSKQVVVERRTPLMIAAKYGSFDVVKLILSLAVVDHVNLSCGPDKSTALHCAASGGSVKSVEVVRLLLLAGADPFVTDHNGHRPFDVIVAPWNMPRIKVSLEELLNNVVPVCIDDLQESSFDDAKMSGVALERKEYPVDLSFPDIRSSMYSSNEFRMYLFKIWPCFRAYCHDWTKCPFVHPGENARRRDPRKFQYTGVPCLDYRRGACQRGDLCQYAHGVFETWLHPTQYRTRFCKDGANCKRRVCFFAHKPEELRRLCGPGLAIQPPQYAASAVPATDKAAAMNYLPSSPSTLCAMPVPTLSPAMSPSVNSWPQQVPTLHSHLRSSLNARDIPQFSPQYPDQVNAPNSVLLNQPQQHQIGFPPQVDSALEASLPETISPWNGETISLSNTGILAYSNLEKQQQMPGSLCSRELGYKTSDYLQANAGSKWEIPNGKVDWSVQGEPGQFIGHYGVEPAFHGLGFC